MYKKKMSPDNPTQILTTHDLSTLRTLQRVINTTNNNNNNNNTSLENNIIYNSLNNSNNINNHLQNYHHNNITNGASNHHKASGSSHNSNTGGSGNLVFSTIPLDGHALLIQQPTSHHLLQASNAAVSSLNTSHSLQQVAQQPARALVTSTAATTTTNGLRAVNSNNITSNTVTSSIGPAGVTTYISNSGGGHSGFNHNNNISGGNNNSLNNFLAKATILSAPNLSNAKASGGKIFTTGGATNFLGSSSYNNTSLNTITTSSMPTTSKYVLLQPNGNGQFTTYEGATPAAAAAAAAANGHSTGAPSVGNIVLLATEPMDLNGGSTTLAGGGDAAAVGRIIATAGGGTGDGNDDGELRPLAWLNDSNLIKDIVTTTAGIAGGANVVKRVGTMANGNICILNTTNAHELIEELPHHVVGNEEVTTTTSSSSGNVSSTSGGGASGAGGGSNTTQQELKTGNGAQITPLSVSDFQQLKRFGNIITAGTPITLLPAAHDTTTIASNTGSARKSDEPSAHIFGNIGAISATTTVHMGPSGTTTVVEYKSNGNMPALQPRQLLSAATSVGGNNAVSSGGTTITPTNLSTIASNNNNNNINTIINSSNSNYVPSSTSSSSAGSSSFSAQSINVSSASTMAAANPPASSTSVSYTMTTSSSTLSMASGAGGPTVLSLPKQFTTLPSGVVTVTNGNGITSTIYQGQQQQKQPSIANNNNNNNNNNNVNINTSTSSTTHHPHKKYLREKMNVLDHGGGSGGSGGGVGSGILASTLNGGGNVSASSVTVVASPASSSSSFSSSLSLSSSSSSTAAVNGGNSPISKSFYAGVAANNSHSHNNSVSGNNNSSNNNNNSGAINYSNTANASPSVMLSNNNNASGGPNGNSTVGSPTTTGSLPTYTIMQYQSVASSPGISSPEPNNSKEFYPLIAPQHQLQQQQRNSMRSPTSYSSYDNDSLKDFEISTNGSSGLSRHNTSTPQHQSAHQLSSSGSSSASSKNSHSVGGGNGIHSGGGVGANGSLTPQKQKHPNNVPYDPFVHTHNKPPYSFSSLIFMAIEGSNEKALPVKEIYAWIMQHFPYFKTAPAGWKNSVRHNLSLNKSFVKVEKAPNMGKGSLWRVEPQQRQNLIQALNRSPFFPNSAVEKSAQSLKSPGGSSIGGIGNDSLIGYDTVDSVGSGGACSPAPKTNINPRIDPRLFPKLSKVIGAQGLLNDVVVTGDIPDEDTPSDYSTINHNNNMNNSSSNNNKYNNYNSTALQQQNVGSGGKSSAGNGGGGGSGGATILGHFSNYEIIERLARDCGADSIDDVNAATAMLALKHGPKVFAETFQNGAPVITSSPSEDHTYSAGGAGNSGGSTPNAANGSAAPTKAINVTAQQQQHNGSQNGDNQSTSSDAAYESSEDNNNITPEELEDQRRQREGVDALLSLSRSSVVESPTKRPSSTSVEEEHISTCLESNKTNTNNNHNHFTNGNAKMSLLTSAVAYSQQQHHVYEDSGNGFHTPPSFYGVSHQMHHHISGLGSAQRKIKPLRSLRTKIKRKAPWMSKAR
ncbi:uncharacterized protein CHES-1-like isoform X2 [Eurosta solidaginis]|uniref:uncharacterized protein CHES-1-like isoform X2 n=1 Tax=Eurosta solidaginis TaxID=178769 RepID=UPI00353125C1